MIGFRRKPGNKDQPKPQKKKWEEEMEDQEDGDGNSAIVIDKAELAQLAKSDDEEDEKKISEENQQQVIVSVHMQSLKLFRKELWE